MVAKYATTQEVIDELDSLDIQNPNVGALPVANVIGVAHCGTRSVEQYMQSQGYHTRLIHVQQHWHSAGFCQALIDIDPATNPRVGITVLALRDPLLGLLSTQARQDDTLDVTWKNMLQLGALVWPVTPQVFPVEMDTRLTDVGNFGQYQGKVLYQQGDKIALASLLGKYWDLLVGSKTAWQPRLQTYGYTNLLWWQ